MSDGALRVLAAVFDISSDSATKKVEKLNAAIETSKTGLQALASSLVAKFSVNALAGFIEEQIDLGSKLNDTAEKLGVGTDELQKFQYAAGLSGVEAEGAAQALGFLNKNLGEALGGSKEAAQTFAGLGIALKDGKGDVRELGDLLPELADSFEQMGSDQERTANAMKIFGKSGASLIPLLKQGGAELAKMSADFEALGGGIDANAIKQFDAAGDEIDRFKFSLRSLKSLVAVSVLPMVTDLAVKAQKFMGHARQLAKDTDIVREGMAALGVVGAIAGLQAAAGWAKFLGLVPKDAKFWESILALGPIALAIAGFGLLYLIFEDIFGFLTGKDSLIGELIDRFLGVGEANELLAQFRNTWDMLSKMWSTDLEQLKPIGEWFANMGKQAVPYLMAQFVDLMRIVGGFIAMLGVGTKALAQFGAGDFKGALESVKAGAKGIFGDGGILSKSAVGDLQLRTEGQAIAARPELPYTDRGGRGDVNVNVEVGDVNVKGGDSPGATAREVGRRLGGDIERQIQDAAHALPAFGGE